MLSSTATAQGTLSLQPPCANRSMYCARRQQEENKAPTYWSALLSCAVASHCSSAPTRLPPNLLARKFHANGASTYQTRPKTTSRRNETEASPPSVLPTFPRLHQRFQPSTYIALLAAMMARSHKYQSISETKVQVRNQFRACGST
jgi:hypothetical protein